MSEWKDTKIGLEATYVNRGVSPKYTENTELGISVINQKCIRNGRINLSLARLHDKSKSANSEKYLQKGDILINSTGVGTAGRIAIFDEPIKALVDSHVTIVRPDKSLIHPEYLFHSLRYREDEIESYAEGSTGQIELGREKVKDIDITKPDSLEEQKAIASVLSSLDDKIDLLHRQNTTLEHMAETLFRQWFVEEAQEDWEVGTLKQEFDFTMGQSPSGTSFNEEGIGVPMFQGNADFGFRFPTERVYTTEPTRFAEPMDTLISVRAPVGAQNMANTKCCIGRGVAAFRYKNNPYFYTYTYFKLRSLMEEIKQFNDEGTVFGSISKSDFENLVTSLPNNEYVLKFEAEVKPVNDKIIKNCEQIKTLEKLRDNLLPKLMSGEVRVL